MGSYVEEIDNKGYGYVVHTDNNEERTAHTAAAVSKSKGRGTIHTEVSTMTPSHIDSTGEVNTGKYKIFCKYHPDRSWEGRFEGHEFRGIGLYARVPLCPDKFKLKATALCEPDHDGQAGTVTAEM